MKYLLPLLFSSCSPTVFIPVAGAADDGSAFFIIFLIFGLGLIVCIFLNKNT